MIKLYTSPVSPSGKRVQIAAAELGVPLEPIMLNFKQGENRGSEYLALNPMGKIPTAKDGDFVLWESGAILCYLAQTSPGGAALLPPEPQAYANTLRWLFFCSCHIDPYFTTLVVERFVKARQGQPPDEIHCAKAERWLSGFIPILEQQLAAADYVAVRFGLADIALGCTLELSALLSYDLAPYPRVREWLGRLQERASWRAASSQPGSLQGPSRAVAS